MLPKSTNKHFHLILNLNTWYFHDGMNNQGEIIEKQLEGSFSVNTHESLPYIVLYKLC